MVVLVFHYEKVSEVRIVLTFLPSESDGNIDEFTHDSCLFPTHSDYFVVKFLQISIQLLEHSHYSLIYYIHHSARVHIPPVNYSAFWRSVHWDDKWGEQIGVGFLFIAQRRLDLSQFLGSFFRHIWNCLVKPLGFA